MGVENANKQKGRERKKALVRKRADLKEKEGLLADYPPDGNKVKGCY